MDCRTSLFAAFVLTLGAAGCATPSTTSSPNNPVKNADFPVQTAKPAAPAPANQERGKSQVRPTVGVALAAIEEEKADESDNLEAQIRFRDRARKMYQEVLTVDPHNRTAIDGLARTYTKLGEFDRALEVYNKALAKNPNDAPLWYAMGMCQNCQKRFDEGARCLQKAEAIDPENRQYMETLGFTLARAGKEDAALAELTRVFGEAGAHFNLAKMQLHMNQPERSAVHLRLALQIDPNRADARDMLAQVSPPPTTAARLSLMAN